MKKLLIATILILGLTTVPVFAQEEELPTEQGEEEVQIQIQEVEEESEPEEDDEDTNTLSEELQVTQQSNISFLTILFAVLTPALLIVVAYLLIKMSNK
jgi:uncharacterized membrane protein